MLKTKRYLRILRLPVLVISSFFIAMFALTPSAYAAYIEVGTVVQRSDGTVSVDWKDRTGSNQWTQTVLQKQADGNYTQTVQIGNDQVSLYTKPATDTGAIRVGATSTGTIDVWEGTGYPETAYATVVSQEVYDQMKPYIAQGMTEQQAITAVKEAQAATAAAAAAVTAAAATAASQECGVDGGTSFFECSGSDNPIQQVFVTIVKNLFVGVGIVCLIGVVMGGIVYASAGGDSGKTKQGITYVVNSIIGLVVFIGAYTLLNFMVPNGYFDQAGIDTSSPADPSGANLPQVDNWQVGGGPY